jgi:hypothetical protein
MNIENRLSKLEAKAPAEDDWKVFRVIGRSDEECQAGIDRLISSGEARPTDRFMCRLIVSPPIREEAIDLGQSGEALAVTSGEVRR